MKKIINMLIIISVFLTLTACNNYKDYIFELKEDNTYEITGYIGEDVEIKIPSSYKGKKVTSIGVNSFRENMALVAILIPNSITEIHSAAFFECSNLTNIVIPNSVTNIGDYVFSRSSLTSVIIPDSVTSIGDHAFYECRNLVSITIPSSVMYIGLAAFFYCDALVIYAESESRPEGWVWMGNDEVRTIVWGHISNGITAEGLKYGISHIEDEDLVVIVGYIGEETEVHIPETIEGINVKRIADSAFAYNIIITSIDIPDTVTSIGYDVFYNCSSLTSVVVSSNITSMEGGLFYGCSSLIDIVIPDNITIIGPFVFYNCSSLTSISIPTSVTSIGADAFNGCILLASIVIPISVIEIGNSAFYKCNNATFYVMAESKPVGWRVNWKPEERPVVWGYTGE